MFNVVIYIMHLIIIGLRGYYVYFIIVIIEAKHTLLLALKND